MAKVSTKIKYGLVAVIAGLMPALTANAGGSSMTNRSNVVPTGVSITNNGTPADMDNGNPSHHLRRGAAHYEAKDYDMASKFFRRVLQKRPRDAKANVYMASIKSMRGDYKNAIPYYNRSLRTFQNDPALLAGLGISYAKTEKYDRAARILTRLETSSKACDNTCEQAPMIAASLHILSLAMYSAE